MKSLQIPFKYRLVFTTAIFQFLITSSKRLFEGRWCLLRTRELPRKLAVALVARLPVNLGVQYFYNSMCSMCIYTYMYIYIFIYLFICLFSHIYIYISIYIFIAYCIFSYVVWLLWVWTRRTSKKTTKQSKNNKNWANNWKHDLLGCRDFSNKPADLLDLHPSVLMVP